MEASLASGFSGNRAANACKRDRGSHRLANDELLDVRLGKSSQ
jgi:hypothetical protein